ncbi:MAG: cytochrome c3 family protein [Bacteroidota bacterium]
MMKKNLLIASIVTALVALVFISRSSAVASDDAPVDKKQVLKFSHSKHADAGIECSSCHTPEKLTKNAPEKMLPTHTECQSCHEQEVNEKCGFCHTDENNPVALPNPVREIQFDHQKHVVDQKVECVTCHQGMEKTDYAEATNLPAMTTCTTCHNGAKAPNQCEACHTNLSGLRPASHMVANFKREHSRVMNGRTFDANCQSCHTEASCMECHDGTNLTKLSKFEKTGTMSPRKFGNDKPAALAVQNVHDLNYKFTHGIDAKGRSADCQTCHRQQTFCSDCHMTGSAALGGAVPTSHEQAGFTTFGVGSGGGIHATLAKRDIQSCASCHDAQGGDPTCITCHTDNDGIKGTNPKTHANGFMKDVTGEWHDDAASTCFVCHTDANARPNGKPGQNFCGYCHGANVQ